jgi:hypothetical protein
MKFHVSIAICSEHEMYEVLEEKCAQIRPFLQAPYSANH